MNDLPKTEARHPHTAGLDALETPALVDALVSDQRGAATAVLARGHEIAILVDAVAERIARGGRLHYVGAGSSGRLAVLDAAEMPPTFGVAAEVVCAHVAGGHAALVAAIEGAEDDGESGGNAITGHVGGDDAVVGISASGSAAFVIGAIECARGLGALTAAIVNTEGSPLEGVAEVTIVLDTGAEALTGSTRLKAGTAQKIALNTLSTAVMVRLGKVHENLMVDVVVTNRKLRTRALRLVALLAGVGETRAQELLERAGGSVKVAVVMERRGVDAPAARALLAAHPTLRSLL